MQRNPSHLGSYCQSPPSGRSLASFASMGARDFTGIAPALSDFFAAAADGIDRSKSAAPRILVIVHQNSIVRALGDAVLGGNDLWMPGFQFLGQCFRKCPNVFLQRSAHNRDVNVQTPGAGGLGITEDLQF